MWVKEMYTLFNVIAYNTGNEFNLEGLSQESGVDKLTIRRYIEYLEAITPMDDHFGQMVETAIVAQWLHWGNIPLYFAAWKGGEVDLIRVKPDQKPYWAMEVKWSNQYVQNPGKLKSLIKYCKENKFKNAWITSIDKFARIEIQGLP